MLPRRNRIVAALLWLSAMSVGSYAADREQQEPLNVCIAAAQANFELFRFEASILASQCECVKRQRRGKLPGTVAEWANTGKGSANLAYVECAKSEIISFYSGVVLQSEMATLEKRGAALDEREVQRAEDFSACVGEGSYDEVRRVAATAPTQPGTLNKPRFLEMYNRCLRAANQTR